MCPFVKEKGTFVKKHAKHSKTFLIVICCLKESVNHELSLIWNTLLLNATNYVVTEFQARIQIILRFKCDKCNLSKFHSYLIHTVFYRTGRGYGYF